MLWSFDSAHLWTQVNHLFALPKQAPKNARNIFPICEIWGNVQAEVLCQYGWFSERKKRFLKRPRAWNTQPISKFQEANKIPRCWEHVPKMSAKNIKICEGYSKTKPDGLSWPTLYLNLSYKKRFHGSKTIPHKMAKCSDHFLTNSADQLTHSEYARPRKCNWYKKTPCTCGQIFLKSRCTRNRVKTVQNVGNRKF